MRACGTVCNSPKGAAKAASHLHPMVAGIHAGMRVWSVEGVQGTHPGRRFSIIR